MNDERFSVLRNLIKLRPTDRFHQGNCLARLFQAEAQLEIFPFFSNKIAAFFLHLNSLFSAAAHDGSHATPSIVRCCYWLRMPPPQVRVGDFQNEQIPVINVRTKFNGIIEC